MNKLFLEKNLLAICMIVFSLIIYFIGILFVTNKLSWSLGVLFGLVFSILKLKLMEKTFSKALQMPEAKARSYATFHYMLRYLLTGVVLVISALEASINMLGVLVGIVSMKVAAYVQPALIKKIQQ